MTDTAEARPETLRRWFLEAGTWTGDDHLWRNRFVETYKEHVALSARLAQAEQERDGFETKLIGCRARADEYEEALKRIGLAGYVRTGSSGYEDAATGDPRLEALADIARAALEESAAAQGPRTKGRLPVADASETGDTDG